MDSIGIYLRIAACLGIVVLLCLLAAMFRRESVKRDLRERGCKPIRIWWVVYTSWAWTADRMPFRVIYSDQNHFIHKAYCWVGHRLMDSPFGPRRVTWVKDEITGELPLPEVYANDEIVRGQLEDKN